MNHNDKIYLSDLNLAQYTRELMRWNAAGKIIEQDDLLLTMGTADFPSTRVAIRLNYTQEGSDSAVFKRIRSFFDREKSSFSLHVRRHADTQMEDICKKVKMIQIGDAPGMVLDRPLSGEIPHRGVDIRHITDIAGIMDFAFVVRESYQSLGLPADISDQIFASPDRMLQPHNDWVVAYDSDRPVSAAMTLFFHGAAGLYWVGTLQNSRGKGLGRACVHEATNEAFRRGASLVVLQASKFGEPLYRLMGFEEVTRYPWYAYFKPS